MTQAAVSCAIAVLVKQALRAADTAGSAYCRNKTSHVIRVKPSLYALALDISLLTILIALGILLSAASMGILLSASICR